MVMDGSVCGSVAGWCSGCSGQYYHPHLSEDMGLNPTRGTATPVHPTVMGYWVPLCGYLEVEASLQIPAHHCMTG